MKEEVTRLLNAVQDGESDASEGLMELVYGELRKMAAGRMANERAGHTLQATALVNEAWMRLSEHGWKNRRHFFAAASEAMRRVLIDHARKRNREKRGSGVVPEQLEESRIEGVDEDERLLKVHEALDQLSIEDAYKAEIVKMRFFVGLSHIEIGEILEVSEKTVRRHWEVAKILLHRIIEESE